MYAGLVLFLVISGSALLLATGGIETGEVASGDGSALDANSTATGDEYDVVAAYLDDPYIVIELESGCLGYIMPEGNKKFGQPTLSRDRDHVVFTVQEEMSCKTVTLRLSDRSRQEYDYCPVTTS